MADEKYGATINLRLTGYWPYQEGLSAEERLMEGGTNDRRGRALITYEMWKSDPESYPYVSLAGDYTLWPDGQLIEIPWVDGTIVPGRVVDTGSHFYGAGKVYREPGYEPIDVCVDSSRTQIPRLVTATIPEGNNFTGEPVKTEGFRGQVVTFGLLAAGGMGGCGGTEGLAIFLAFASLYWFIRALMESA
jgi:hypothetical protein